MCDPTGEVIEAKENARDLGVVMNDQGTFTDHIEKVTTDCRRTMAMIFRSFSTRDEMTLKTLYKSLILSKLDYCSPLYMPTKITDVRMLERVQFDFTLRINGMSENERPINYWKRLERLGMYSVERRHERYAIMYTWKALQGMTRNPGFEFINSGRRGTTVKEYAVGKLRSSSFVVRGAKLFNAIPKEVRNIGTGDLECRVAGIVPAYCT